MMARAQKPQVLRYLYISLGILILFLVYQHNERMKHELVEEQKATEKFLNLYSETLKNLEVTNAKCGFTSQQSVHSATGRQNLVHSSDTGDVGEVQSMADELKHLRALVYELHGKLENNGIREDEINSGVDYEAYHSDAAHDTYTRRKHKPLKLTETVAGFEEKEVGEAIESEGWSQKEEFIDPKTFQNHDAAESDNDEDEADDLEKKGKHEAHTDSTHVVHSQAASKEKVETAKDPPSSKRGVDKLRGKSKGN